MDIKLLFKGFLVLLLFILLLCIEQTFADVTSNQPSSTQTNNSGAQTNIQGYESTTTNTYQSGSSNDTTNSTTNNSNSKTAVPSANAPAMQSYGQRSCIIGLSGGFTVIGFSTSIGSYIEDENCNRRLNAELLDRLNMKIASISLLCQDEDIFEAMLISATPCPVLHNGKSLIGKEAMKVILDRRSNKKNSDKKTSMMWNKDMLGKPYENNFINK